MATNKPTGRAMLSAYGTMPTGPDDPRFMSVEDVSKAVDDLTDNLSPTSQSGETLESLTDRIWARHNARPAPVQASSPEPAAHHNADRPRSRKEPQSVADLHDAAWAKFRNPPKGQSLQGTR